MLKHIFIRNISGFVGDHHINLEKTDYDINKWQGIGANLPDQNGEKGSNFVAFLGGANTRKTLVLTLISLINTSRISECQDNYEITKPTLDGEGAVIFKEGIFVAETINCNDTTHDGGTDGAVEENMNGCYGIYIPSTQESWQWSATSKETNSPAFVYQPKLRTLTVFGHLPRCHYDHHSFRDIHQKADSETLLNFFQGILDKVFNNEMDCDHEVPSPPVHMFPSKVIRTADTSDVWWKELAGLLQGEHNVIDKPLQKRLIEQTLSSENIKCKCFLLDNIQDILKDRKEVKRFGKMCSERKIQIICTTQKSQSVVQYAVNPVVRFSKNHNMSLTVQTLGEKILVQCRRKTLPYSVLTSDLLLLLEGKSDENVMTTLFGVLGETSRLDPLFKQLTSQVHCLCTGGKGDFPRYLEVCLENGFKHFVVCDRDGVLGGSAGKMANTTSSRNRREFSFDSISRSILLANSGNNILKNCCKFLKNGNKIRELKHKLAQRAYSPLCDRLVEKDISYNQLDDETIKTLVFEGGEIRATTVSDFSEQLLHTFSWQEGKGDLESVFTLTFPKLKDEKDLKRKLGENDIEEECKQLLVKRNREIHRFCHFITEIVIPMCARVDGADN